MKIRGMKWGRDALKKRLLSDDGDDDDSDSSSSSSSPHNSKQGIVGVKVFDQIIPDAPTQTVSRSFDSDWSSFDDEQPSVSSFATSFGDDEQRKLAFMLRSPPPARLVSKTLQNVGSLKDRMEFLTNKGTVTTSCSKQAVVVEDLFLVVPSESSKSKKQAVPISQPFFVVEDEVTKTPKKKKAKEQAVVAPKTPTTKSVKDKPQTPKTRTISPVKLKQKEPSSVAVEPPHTPKTAAASSSKFDNAAPNTPKTPKTRKKTEAADPKTPRSAAASKKSDDAPPKTPNAAAYACSKDETTPKSPAKKKTDKSPKKKKAEDGNPKSPSKSVKDDDAERKTTLAKKDVTTTATAKVSKTKAKTKETLTSKGEEKAVPKPKEPEEPEFPKGVEVDFDASSTPSPSTSSPASPSQRPRTPAKSKKSKTKETRTSRGEEEAVPKPTEAAEQEISKGVEVVSSAVDFDAGRDDTKETLTPPSFASSPAPNQRPVKSKKAKVKKTLTSKGEEEAVPKPIEPAELEIPEGVEVSASVDFDAGRDDAKETSTPSPPTPSPRPPPCQRPLAPTKSESDSSSSSCDESSEPPPKSLSSKPPPPVKRSWLDSSDDDDDDDDDDSSYSSGDDSDFYKKESKKDVSGCYKDSKKDVWIKLSPQKEEEDPQTTVQEEINPAVEESSPQQLPDDSNPVTIDDDLPKETLSQLPDATVSISEPDLDPFDGSQNDSVLIAETPSKRLSFDDSDSDSSDSDPGANHYVSSYDEQRRALASRRAPPMRAISKSLENVVSLKDRMAFLSGAPKPIAQCSPVVEAASPANTRTGVVFDGNRSARFQELLRLTRNSTSEVVSEYPPESPKKGLSGGNGSFRLDELLPGEHAETNRSPEKGLAKDFAVDGNRSVRFQELRRLAQIAANEALSEDLSESPKKGLSGGNGGFRLEELLPGEHTGTDRSPEKSLAKDFAADGNRSVRFQELRRLAQIAANEALSDDDEECNNHATSTIDSAARNPSKRCENSTQQEGPSDSLEPVTPKFAELRRRAMRLAHEIGSDDEEGQPNDCRTPVSRLAPSPASRHSLAKVQSQPGHHTPKHQLMNAKDAETVTPRVVELRKIAKPNEIGFEDDEGQTSVARTPTSRRHSSCGQGSTESLAPMCNYGPSRSKPGSAQPGSDSTEVSKRAAPRRAVSKSLQHVSSLKDRMEFLGENTSKNGTNSDAKRRAEEARSIRFDELRKRATHVEKLVSSIDDHAVDADRHFNAKIQMHASLNNSSGSGMQLLHSHACPPVFSRNIAALVSPRKALLPKKSISKPYSSISIPDSSIEAKESSLKCVEIVVTPLAVSESKKSLCFNDADPSVAEASCRPRPSRMMSKSLANISSLKDRMKFLSQGPSESPSEGRCVARKLSEGVFPNEDKTVPKEEASNTMAALSSCALTCASHNSQVSTQSPRPAMLKVSEFDCDSESGSSESDYSVNGANATYEEQRKEALRRAAPPLRAVSKSLENVGCVKQRMAFLKETSAAAAASSIFASLMARKAPSDQANGNPCTGGVAKKGEN